MKLKILVVAGARPNFMKIAPLMREFKKQKEKFLVRLVHTGQHYDFNMSEIFFKNLGIPNPNIFLNVGSASHAVQTAKIMLAFEKVLIDEKPDLLIVVGDVNSTLACSLTAKKLNIKIAHVESGLRSFDWDMPEEINRLVTDKLSDYLFVSEQSGVVNLKKEGINASKIFYVGNTMIDTLFQNMSKIEQSSILKTIDLTPKTFAIVTLHRPSNVDSKKAMQEIIDILKDIGHVTTVIYPIHPRTKNMIIKNSLMKEFESIPGLKTIKPQGYFDFMKLVKNAQFVLTDSGGIQEETTVLGIPCLTMRENTERPSTVKEGTNTLVGRNKKMILKYVRQIKQASYKKGTMPKYWDGRTAQRIISHLRNIKKT